LHGIPLGVKDLMDTGDMPTTYGSPIYAAHRPASDAACVAASRAAGAIVMGKTVTTEFATFKPGKTRNPRGLPGDRTPGGSSSGSAAAVAAGMVPAAFGTQTAGSIIRPAAYCGVVGYKPTTGTLSVAGVKLQCPSMDTVGVIACDVDMAALVVNTLARLPQVPVLADGSGLRVGLMPTPYWARAQGATREALAFAARLLEQSGASVSDCEVPAHWSALNQAQLDIMSYEAQAAFGWEIAHCAQHFSPSFAAYLAAGAALDGEAWRAAQRLAEAVRADMATVFARYDILLAPSTEGEAPASDTTGDPVFNRMWSLLGNPCVHVPTGSGPAGLPVGVTVVAARYADARALSVAALLEKSVQGM
jgi:amidase